MEVFVENSLAACDRSDSSTAVKEVLSSELCSAELAKLEAEKVLYNVSKNPAAKVETLPNRT
ncbi:MAG: hypothetical protein AAF810_09045 [Cyanobacteria bacterium P01_D01_bin.36]